MLAIIPARGGSKGLPGKNIRSLHGKPLIAHTIEAALNASMITRVICSTDSQEIANIALSAGAEVPFLRPAHLALDNSLAIDNYVYTVDRLITEGMKENSYCVLLPTTPLRNAADIDGAIKVFNDNNADSVISCYPAPHPLLWYRYIDENGVLRNYDSNSNQLANRQQEQQSYLPNGAIYVFRHEILKNTRRYYTERTFPYLMPANRSVDIDSIDDFEYAEYLLAKGR